MKLYEGLFQRHTDEHCHRRRHSRLLSHAALSKLPATCSTHAVNYLSHAVLMQ